MTALFLDTVTAEQVAHAWAKNKTVCLNRQDLSFIRLSALQAKSDTGLRLAVWQGDSDRIVMVDYVISFVKPTLTLSEMMKRVADEQDTPADFAEVLCRLADETAGMA